MALYVHPIMLDKLGYKQTNIQVHYSTLPNTSPLVLLCLLINHTTNGTAPTISSTSRMTASTAMIGTTTASRGAAVGSGSEAGWLEVGVVSEVGVVVV